MGDPVFEGVSNTQAMVLALAGVVYGLTKTGIFGLAAAIVPLLLYVFTPSEALGIAAPMLLTADIIAVLIYRRSVNWRVALYSIPWFLIGLGIGWRLLHHVQNMGSAEGDPLLRRLISSMIVCVVITGLVVRVAGERRAASGSPGEVPAQAFARPGRMLLAGGMALIGGFITMIANNSGPAWVVYLMLFRLPKLDFLGTVAWMVFFINLAKLPLVIQLGFVSADTLWLNLCMVPFLAVGVAAGRRIANRISQKFFDNFTQGLALLGGVYLFLSS